MKKFLLFAILLLQVSISFSQNYQCVQPGIKRYFIGTNHYLRGIRIDSVKMVGNASILYPFHSFRGDSTLDTNGGCWMGKSIVVNNDGTTWFNNFWNDTVIIKTQATLYDSWTFYNDTSQRNYTATVTSLDTMTVLGVLDSVKTITLTCKKGSSTLTTDAFHNAQIIISKNYGFVQTYDLDMFPLQKAGVDYLTDNAGWSTFDLIDFQNPTSFDFYDFKVGDVFKRWFDLGSHLKLSTVQSKQISGNKIQYTAFTYDQIGTYIGPAQTSVGTTYQTIEFDFFIEHDLMPEEFGTSASYYYDPNDTVFCVSGKYTHESGLIQPRSLVLYKGGLGNSYIVSYKKELGDIYTQHFDGNLLTYTHLVGAYKGYICDSMPTLAVPETVKEKDISIYPNPGNGFVTIGNQSNSAIRQIVFYNLIGSKVYEVNVTTQKNEYAIQLPGSVKGVLFCTIVTDERRVVKKLVVE